MGCTQTPTEHKPQTRPTSRDKYYSRLFDHNPSQTDFVAKEQTKEYGAILVFGYVRQIIENKYLSLIIAADIKGEGIGYLWKKMLFVIVWIIIVVLQVKRCTNWQRQTRKAKYVLGIELSGYFSREMMRVFVRTCVKTIIGLLYREITNNL
eukprot:672301_1